MPRRRPKRLKFCPLWVALVSIITFACNAVVNFLIMIAVRLVCCGLRVSGERERLGIVQAAHGENACND